MTFATNETSASIISGFTISGGNGGIRCFRASPTIIDCTITGNTVSGTANRGGGGILIVADTPSSTASPTITNCRISNNTSVNLRGGGVYCEAASGTSNIVVTNCRITENVAIFQRGGGIAYNGQNITTTITDCSIESNFGYQYGGGCDFDAITAATVRRTRLIENHAYSNSGNTFGGAITTLGATVNVVNCLIARNSADTGGGAIFITSTNGFNIQDSTIVDNIAPSLGGILQNSSGPIGIVNSIVWGNVGIQVISVGAVTTSACNIQSPSMGLGGTTISLDPGFVDPTIGDYHLSSLSPCVDAGVIGGLSVSSTDLDGSSRIVGTIDIGADERPLQPLAGTNEDFELFAVVDGGDPMATTIPSYAGSEVVVKMRSLGGDLAGAVPLLAGQFFLTGTPPTSPVGFPQLHLNGTGVFIILGSIPTGSFIQPGIGTGINLVTAVPPGLVGASLRLQAFGLTTLAQNGLYATTSARDLEFL